MASGLEMYNAVRKAAERIGAGGTLKINPSDIRDLCKLTAEDLGSEGFDQETSQRMLSDLSHGNLDELSRALGVVIVAEKGTLGLIPGEGIKRASERLKDDPQTLEEMLQELAWMRNPQRYRKP